MRRHQIALILLFLATATLPCRAQVEPASENLVITARQATTWTDGDSNIVQLEGPVTIDLDRTRLAADKAVVWLSPSKRSVIEQQDVQVALLGNTVIEQQGQSRREGERQYVTAIVRGVVRVTADQRKVGNLEKSELYQAASALRPLKAGTDAPDLDNWLLTPLLPAATQPTTQPARRNRPVAFSADKIETQYVSDGTLAVVVTGNVKLFQRRGEVEMIELQADRGVLFTPLKSLRELESSERFKKIEDAVTSAYLEGDVRIVNTPPGRKQPDQRLKANRVYYDLETDRAVLTDAVIHAIEPQRSIPVIVRAQTVRQLSTGEYRGEKVKLTTSSFHTPSYHIGMSQAYVRQFDTGDPRYGTLTHFSGKDMTMNVHGLPLFWLPGVAGSFTQRGGPLRDIQFSQSSKFGFGIETEWGLFETLGRMPPRELDVGFSVDYYTDRGLGLGIGGKYGGGFITETTKQPWNFEGKWDAWGIYDSGEDDLGRRRLLVEPPDEFRYHLLWEHQHFFPDNWQLQVTAAMISDATFQEEWYRDDFWGSRPLDTALYLKRQEQTEAFTLLASWQLNDFVTTSDLQQEQLEIERVPEIGYRRIGDTLGQGGPTLFSENTFGGYRFQNSSASFREQGFRGADSPGLPSLGVTGSPTDVTYRADFRQELDFPFTLGQFRFVPWVVGRYTVYTDSPEDSNNDRFFAGAGVRLTTAFWKVDDTAHSKIFDINRLRHVIEPEVNMFTSAQTTGSDRLFIYDEQVDAINDLTAIQLALRQRWQTKRGGPGRWRSVDFFAFNVYGNLFLNQPDEDELTPQSFRGLYFASLPESSIPRNSINADAAWRVSDTTVVLSDASYNLDEQNLATASIGLAVSRDDRLNYFIALRYIQSGEFPIVNTGGALVNAELDSAVFTVAATYDLTTKYTLAGRFSYDFGEDEKVQSNFTVIRHFDRWYASFTIRADYLGDDTGLFFNVWPEGLAGQAANAQRLQQVFR